MDMESFMNKIIIKALLCNSLCTFAYSQAPIAKFEDNEIRVPTLEISDKYYESVTLKYLGGVEFEVTQVLDSDRTFINVASKFESGKLLLNSLEVGEDTYTDLTFDYIGGIKLSLSKFSGPINNLEFKETPFTIREPGSWKTTETIYNAKTSDFDKKSGNIFTMDFPIMDIDRDGLKDIIIAGVKYENDSFIDKKVPLRWLKNTGKSFELGDSSIFPESSSRVHIRFAYVADFNNDGFDDFFAAAHGLDTAPFSGEANLLLLSDPNGGLIDAGKDDPLFNYSGYTHAASIGDVNNDGNLDIVTSDICCGVDRNGMTRILVNDGTGKFTRNESKAMPDSTVNPLYNNAGIAVSLIDLDQDKDDDLIIGSMNKEKGDRVYWNSGDGVFDFSEFTSLPVFLDINNQPLYESLDILGTDLNFDGVMDLVISKTAKYQSMGLQFLINEGDKNFTDATNKYSPWAYELPQNSQAIPFWLEELDINKDGLPDLKLNYDKWGDNTYPHLWIRKNDGSYEEYDSTNLPRTGWFWVIDIDQDGDLDLVNRNRVFQGRTGPDNHLSDTFMEWRILSSQIFK